MRKRRTLQTLFVRPDDGRGLDGALRFGVRRGSRDELPVPLLRLASAVKLSSPHRVFVHDGRRAGGGATERSLRSVAALHRPDVSVVWLHPALLADGLEAARAVRHSGCPLVLGAGPLVDLWPEGARRVPELDGLLPSAGRAALLTGLAEIASGSGSRALQAALSGVGAPRMSADPVEPSESQPVEPPPTPSPTIDRKLLDYAAYRRVGERWPATPAEVSTRRRIGRGGTPDKGRWAASTVPLHDDLGLPLRATEVLDDMADCDLLGIPWQALEPGLGREALPLAWWEDLLDVLRVATRAREIPSRRLLLTMPAAVTRRSALVDLVSLGVVAIDLGDVDAGSREAVEEAVIAGRACLRSGVQPFATLLLGQPGYSLAEEAAGLDEARGAGIGVVVGVRVHVGTVDPGAWADWLDAPSRGFVPPGVDDDRLALARRTNRVEAVRSFRGGPAGGLRSRLRAFLRG